LAGRIIIYILETVKNIFGWEIYTLEFIYSPTVENILAGRIIIYILESLKIFWLGEL